MLIQKEITKDTQMWFRQKNSTEDVNMVMMKTEWNPKVNELKLKSWRKSSWSLQRIHKYTNNMYPDYLADMVKTMSDAVQGQLTSLTRHTKYQHSDNTCRWCGVDEETLNYIVSCGESEQNFIPDAEKSMGEIGAGGWLLSFHALLILLILYVFEGKI